MMAHMPMMPRSCITVGVASASRLCSQLDACVQMMSALIGLIDQEHESGTKNKLYLSQSHQWKAGRQPAPKPGYPPSRLENKYGGSQPHVYFWTRSRILIFTVSCR